MNGTIATLGACLLIATACSTSNDNRLPPQAVQALRGATKLEIFALDPEPIPDAQRKAGSTTDLHGYPILGRATLTDANARKELVDLVLRGVRESDGKVAACFNPRHGIRAEHDSKTFDLVICYECLSMSIYSGGSGAASKVASALTSQSVEKQVTAVFTAAGLTISTK